MTANVIPMLSAAAGTAKRHPSRIAAETMKTDAMETSDLLLSSIGTGRRSATSASTKKTSAASPVVAFGGSTAIDASESPTIGSATTRVAAMKRARRTGRPRMGLDMGSSGRVREGRCVAAAQQPCLVEVT